MRLGKVVIDIGYVVDLDNEEMVDHAKEALLDDIFSAAKYNETHLWIETIEVNKKDYSEADIPEFLTETLDEED